MTIERFLIMMEFLRGQAREFCAWHPVHLDEAEILIAQLSQFCWDTFAANKGNEALFRSKVEDFVRNEILKGCA